MGAILPSWVLPVVLAAMVLVAAVAALPAMVRAVRGSLWYAHGLRAYRRGRLDRARDCWERAILVVPWYPSAHYNLGVLHAREGRMDEAIAAYEKAIELNPRMARAYFNLGNAYHSREQFRDAARAYEAATQTPRGHARSHLNLGILYQERLLDDRKALFHFTEYLRFGGTDLRILQNIKRLQEKLGR